MLHALLQATQGMRYLILQSIDSLQAAASCSPDVSVWDPWRHGISFGI